jgi:ion channel-forming bestrophin family protein
MYTAREIKAEIILSFAWRSLLFFFVYSVALCSLNVFAEFPIGISFVPIGLIGTAVAFYVGFKNNSSYERLWEARRIWGSIVNASRTWGAFTLAYVKEPMLSVGSDQKKIHAELIYRHIAYVNALRIQLRQKSVWNDSNTIAHTVVKDRESYSDSPLFKNMISFLPEIDVKNFTSYKNPATQIMKAQALHLDALFGSNALTERAYIHMMGLVQEFYNQQGAAERIKNFPFPRQYAHFSKMFVNLFILVLPFGLINEFAKLGGMLVWLSIPAYMVIAWVFYTMEVVGDTSENPFENAVNDVPMTAICRTIEIDLREMLEEEHVPGPVLPVDNILM